MKLRFSLFLAALLLLVGAGYVASQEYTTSGSWKASDTRRLASTTDHLGLGVKGDEPNNDRFQIRADGNMQWGSGSAVPDVEAQRTAANTFTFSTGDTFEAETVTGIGSAALTLGDSATTSISMVTDGGTVTVDGSLQGDVPFLVVTTAATLTANTVHIATTDDATHIMPACVAANLGEWITIVVGDVSENISLSLADASNRFVVSGVDTSAAAHELDSPTAAATSGGASVTLTCLVAEFWHSTAITGVWLDGN